MKTYEAMFLFDSSFASDANKIEQEVGRLMERAGAEVVMSNKWDERKLAYEIKGRKRGCYVLTFFRAETDKITGIERDVHLSEVVLRVLIVRADHMTTEDMEAAYPSRRAAAELGSGEAKAGPEAKAPNRPKKESEAPAAAAEVAEDDSAATKAKDEAPSVSTATEPAPVPAPVPAPEAPVQVDKLGDLGGL